MGLIKDFVSIIICTYNRSHHLKSCVSALLDQNADASLYEIIIVNNNSTDDTQLVAENFASQYENICTVIEVNQGLSYARNRGYLESKNQWIAYLDDDAVPHMDWIERLLFLIQKNKFDAVGGVYLPAYKDTKPRWMKDAYVSNKDHVNKALNKIPGNYFFCGGNFLVKKEVLVDLNGFSTSIGMSGSKVGYGQEDELQVRMSEKGYTIGFDSRLLVDHYVAPYKHNAWWFVRGKYIKGFNSWIAYRQSPELFQLIIYLILVFYKPISGLPKMLHVLSPSRKEYIQNFIIEYFGASCFYFGRFCSGFRLYLKHER